MSDPTAEVSSTSTVKFGVGFEAPWFVARGNVAEMGDQLIEAFGLDYSNAPDPVTLGQIIVDAGTKARALHTAAHQLGGSSEGKPAGQQSGGWSRGNSGGNRGGGQQQAPRQQGGGMVARQGVSSKGEWRGWAKAARGPIDTFADKGTADWDAIGAALGLG